mmetsp:Transcript_25998/g.62624  ORF Transcript_25998/g.62624 Transcript_25998/m.62624 type:complete len:229 (+) Transcript_25998:198-884(+)
MPASTSTVSTNTVAFATALVAAALFCTSLEVGPHRSVSMVLAPTNPAVAGRCSRSQLPFREARRIGTIWSVKAEADRRHGEPNPSRTENVLGQFVVARRDVLLKATPSILSAPFIFAQRAQAEDARTVYLDATLTLEKEIRSFLTDDEMPRREKIALKKEIKSKGFSWVAKYAKGGAVKGYESAKDFYIGLDAIVGFFAADEIRVPRKLKAKVLQKLDDARVLIDAGK